MKINDPIPLRKLRLTDIPKVVALMEAAMEDDPTRQYLTDTPDKDTGYWKQSWHFQLVVGVAVAIHKGNSWTAGDVHAFLSFEPAGRRASIIDKILGQVMSFYSNTIRPHVISKQQIKRAAEFRDKSKEVIGRTLGNRKDEMVLLGDLATHPLYQGRGYGSALVKLVKDHADTGCRDIWLLSSNIKNTGFYNSLGFFTHGEIILGEDDPSWTRPPVIINLMVREYQSKVRTSV